jgi:hypothetical protein
MLYNKLAIIGATFPYVIVWLARGLFDKNKGRPGIRPACRQYRFI